jgi:hypothetical protein
MIQPLDDEANVCISRIMLSKRGCTNASDLDIPWRYVVSGPRGCYDPEENPTGVVTQLTSADNHLMKTELLEFITTSFKLTEQALGYSSSSGGGKRLPASLAAHLNEYWSPQKLLTGEDITLTGSATALHEILGFSLADPGQGMLA